MNETAFTLYWPDLIIVQNVMDRLPVYTKTAHFLPADFENGRDENGALTSIF